jgi:hypothetical protein
MELRRAVDAYNGALEGCGPVTANSHHFDEEQDSDTDQPQSGKKGSGSALKGFCSATLVRYLYLVFTYRTCTCDMDCIR